MNARTNRRPVRARRSPRRGFTLIEIMVVLALTLVMMALFAQIFTMTGTFVTKQKAVGENDQSARILTTVLKTDLQGRTMKLVAPFHPNMNAASIAAMNPTNRWGYFYVSENDPTDDTDDVLQFTCTLNGNYLPATNPAAGGQYYGAALNLATPWQPNTNYPANGFVRPSTALGNTTGFVFKNKGAAFTTGATEPNWSTVTTLAATIGDAGGTWTALASPIDQPDGDDAVIAFDAATPANRTLAPAGSNPNGTGASQYAEVSYFLRHGNLYRRVLLIRSPYDASGETTGQPFDTDTPTPALLIPGLYPPYPANSGSGNFWSDFDYAARIQPVTGGTAPTGVQFLSFGLAEDSLNNANLGAGIPIGRPDNRFGFDQTYVTTPGPVANGAPREFAFQYNSITNSLTAATPPAFFFGRYTHEETSNSIFQFPGNLAVVGGTNVSPMGSTTLLAVDANNYTMWLLDANPPTTPKSLAGGLRRGEDILLTNVVSFDVKLWDPHYSENAGNDVNRNGVIDTGAAFADVGHTAASGDFKQSNNIFPVYGPRVDTGYAVPAAPQWAPAYTRTFNGITYNYNNVFDTWYPQFNFDNLQRTYDAADANSVNAPAPYRPRLGNTWQAGHAYVTGDMVDPVNTANGYTYQCVTAGLSGAAEPFSLSDTVGGPAITDGVATWSAKAPVPVQAIQITVKYLDPTQNVMRQVTIVQSLTQ